MTDTQNSKKWGFSQAGASMLTSLSNLPDVGFSTIKAAASGAHRTVQPFSDRCETETAPHTAGLTA